MKNFISIEKLYIIGSFLIMRLIISKIINEAEKQNSIKTEMQDLYSGLQNNNSVTIIIIYIFFKIN